MAGLLSLSTYCAERVPFTAKCLEETMRFVWLCRSSGYKAPWHDLDSWVFHVYIMTLSRYVHESGYSRQIRLLVYNGTFDLCAKLYFYTPETRAVFIVHFGYYAIFRLFTMRVIM